MSTILEPARSTPVVEDCDVCVVGGSCTGVFAAVAAARLGARVALVENGGYFGGTATASLVAIWHTVLDTVYERTIIGGLTTEIVDRLLARDAAIAHEPNASAHFVLSPYELAIELDLLVAEHSIRPFLHTRFVAPAAEDGLVSAVVIEDKTGRRAIRARQFIDATGDGDLVHRLGLATWRQAALQPPTTTALLQGLAKLPAGFSLARTVFDPQYPEALPRGFLWGVHVPGDDVFMVAGTRVHGCDASDADQLTQAEMGGRQQVRAMLDILRRHVPGGEQVALVGLPARIGLRQSRQVVAQHRLTEQEVLHGVRFDDAIANGSYRVDVHFADRDGLVFRYLDGSELTVYCDGTSERGRWRPESADNPTFYQVPYRSLVPQGARNVLVAGRCLDADEGAFGAVRVMVNCNQMGQAAGVAAWLADEAGVPVGQVDPVRLRGVLAEQGAVVI